MFCILQCPDRDLIFLEDVLGTIITPNGAGAIPDVTPHDTHRKTSVQIRIIMILHKVTSASIMMLER